MGRWLLVAALLALASLARAQIGGPGPGQCKGFRLLKDGTLAACVETVDSTGADFVWTCAAQKCGFALNTNVSHFGSCLDATKICATGGIYTGSLTFGSGGSLTFASGSTLALATGTATLNGETLLPPSSFLLLAGRSSSGNDFTLSTTSNGTITGSSANARSLNLFGNAFGNGTSVINVNGRLKLLMSAAVAQPQLSFQSADGANFNVNLISPTVGADSTYTLPAAVPTVNGQRLSATTGGVMSWKADNPVLADAYCACNGTTDDTAGLTTALTAAAGGTLLIPAECTLLVSGPTAGSAKFTVPANTRIVGVDHSSTVKLAARKCTAGNFGTSSAVGAGCASDTGATDGCGTGGVCSYDIPSAVFAPTNGSSYTLFQWAAGATGEASTFSIDEQGADGFDTCTYTSGGTNPGRACKVAGDCAGGTGAACNGKPRVPYAMSAALSAGKANAIDMNAVTGRQLVEDVYIYDHRQADFDIKTGTGATGRTTEAVIRGVRTNQTKLAYSGLTTPPCTASSNNCSVAIDAGILIGSVCDNVLDTWADAGNGIAFNGASAALGCGVPAMFVNDRFVAANASTFTSAVGARGLRGTVTNANISGYTGMDQPATDLLVEDSRLTSANGPAVRISAAGVKLVGDYIVATTTNSNGVIDLGDAALAASTSHCAIIGSTVASTVGGTYGCIRFVKTGTGHDATIIANNTFVNGAGIDFQDITDATVPVSGVVVSGNVSNLVYVANGPASFSAGITGVTLSGNVWTEALTTNWSTDYSTIDGEVTKEVEIDFGATPALSKTFTITEAHAVAGSVITAAQSGKAATGRQADENEFDRLAFAALPGTGSFSLYATSTTGFVSGKYKVSYALR